VEHADAPLFPPEVTPVSETCRRRGKRRERPHGEGSIGSVPPPVRLHGIEHGRDGPSPDRHVCQRWMQWSSEPAPVEHATEARGSLEHLLDRRLHTLGDAVQNRQPRSSLPGDLETHA
jgi:hypothetical protein